MWLKDHKNFNRWVANPLLIGVMRAIFAVLKTGLEMNEAHVKRKLRCVD